MFDFLQKSSYVERPVVDFDFDVPAKQRYAHIPGELMDEGRELLRAIMTDVPTMAMPLADAARLRTGGRFHEEITALAKQLDRPWRHIMIANISYDLTIAMFGCSTMALATADGPVLARNLDWFPEDLLARSSMLMRYHRAGKPDFTLAGFPGGVGCVSGWSARGFAVVINAVSGLPGDGVSTTGYPVLLFMRRVLEDAADFDEAVKLLSETKLAAPCLLTVVGTENHQRVCIERSPNQCAQRWPEGDAPLFTTNDYRLLGEPDKPAGPSEDPLDYLPAEIYGTTCSRYDALGRLCNGRAPGDSLSDDFFLATLSHPSVLQGITAQHMVIRPRTGHFRLFVPSRFLDARRA